MCSENLKRKRGFFCREVGLGTGFESLFGEGRKQTSPLGFVRADYPKQDDENWLVSLAVGREDNGEFKFTRLPTDG
jgi:hypothetical protein